VKFQAVIGIIQINKNTVLQDLHIFHCPADTKRPICNCQSNPSCVFKSHGFSFPIINAHFTGTSVDLPLPKGNRAPTFNRPKAMRLPESHINYPPNQQIAKAPRPCGTACLAENALL